MADYGVDHGISRRGRRRWMVALTGALAVSACSIETGGGSGEAIGSGKAELQWDIPAKRADGSPLTDLAGYVLYYGDDPKAYAHVIKISGATKNGYVVRSLPAGKFYFSVAAYTQSGEQSGLSAPIAKDITE